MSESRLVCLYCCAAVKLVNAYTMATIAASVRKLLRKACQYIFPSITFAECPEVGRRIPELCFSFRRSKRAQSALYVELWRVTFSSRFSMNFGTKWTLRRFPFKPLACFTHVCAV